MAPDVPFLSDFGRAIGLIDTDPYGEIARYLKIHRDQVGAALGTLSYFDVAILGRRATSPALFSVGLMDEICPPSAVFAAYNWYGGPKIAEYAFNDHEAATSTTRCASCAGWRSTSAATRRGTLAITATGDPRRSCGLLRSR